MGIYRTKTGFRVKSYVTGKYHKKKYKTKKEALKASGKVARRAYYKK
tara:strand:- start:509 stop:649 length:141 start_codon:yes stop_codon:yes gene_type:complete